MRIIAASFRDAERAKRLLEQIRGHYGLGPGDGSIAELGADDRRVVLGGRIRDEHAAAVRRLVRWCDGEILVDVDEGVTQPRRRRGLTEYATSTSDTARRSR